MSLRVWMEMWGVEASQCLQMCKEPPWKKQKAREGLWGTHKVSGLSIESAPGAHWRRVHALSPERQAEAIHRITELRMRQHAQKIVPRMVLQPPRERHDQEVYQEHSFSGRRAMTVGRPDPVGR